MVTIDRQLTSKQETFAIQYALTGNAYQSALFAGYSENTASVKSSQWLEDVRIQQAIARHKVASANVAEQLQVTPQWITARLAIEATGGETASARVAALRTLADIHGMMSGSQTQLPQALGAFLEGVRQAREAISPASTGKQPALIEGTPVSQEEDTHA